jgi:endonuclease/exonuclease/phosphatase family metal-dependent hydrolase
MFFYAILLLFFLQLVSKFIESIYAFGLMGTNIPPEIASILLVFTPILWLFPTGKTIQRKAQGLIVLMLVSRLVYPLLDARGQMMVAGIGVAAFLLLMPALLFEAAANQKAQVAKEMAAGLMLGWLGSVLLRTFGSGIDISTTGWTQVVGWLLAITALFIIPKLKREIPTLESHPPTSKILLLSVGMLACLTMYYFAFSAPNVIARWTGSHYLLIVTVLVAAGVTNAYLTTRSDFWAWLTFEKILAWNILFVVALVTTIQPFQIHFPSDPGLYPLAEPRVGAWVTIPLILMLLLSPVILLDFMLYARRLLELKPSLRQFGEGFLLGAFFLLVMVFAQVFTTVYDYIPVIGPIFRDQFWAVFCVVGLVMLLTALFASRDEPVTSSFTKNLFTISLLLGVIAVDGVLLTRSHPSPAEEKSTLKIMTYNIQQGYGKDGTKNLEEQLALIKQWDVDILGLQESDTNRIAGGNDDVVRYFADHLDMYSYYGPKTVPGTFGIALLSHYPIEQTRTFYMYSIGEQTASIVAQIKLNGKTFNILVTHLGNGGPIVQQEALLREIEGLEPIIAMGDFNFEPNTDQYSLTCQSLEDAWLLRWPGGTDDQGVNPWDRIDYVFLSPGMRVADATYIYSPASDHPALVVELEW